MVNITPAASDSPAEAAVCTMLFSRIFDFLNILSMPIEITAAGMEAETVIPANNPKYAFAPAKTMDSMIPKIMDLKVIPNLNYLKSDNFFLIAGPCAIEGEEMAFKIAENCIKICDTAVLKAKTSLKFPERIFLTASLTSSLPIP